ncbi:hypothetical protein II898_08320 [bacterium]|nr:hypothetical protein [bacterium]
MKRCSIIFLLCSTVLFLSCSSGNKPKNDPDTIPDSDIDSQDSETQNDDEDSQTSEIVDDSERDDADDDETDDSDSDTDEPLDVDYQGAEDCPELSKAKFPYYNDDKSIHFCRKCDTPTVKDPQCMENLWKEAAAKLYDVSPESECRDGYPCEMLDLVPITQAEWDEEWSDPKYPKLPYRPHECDLILDANSVSTKYLWATDETAGSFKHFNISDGKIGIKLKNVSTRLYGQVTRSKVMIYDPVNKKYRAIAPMFDDELAYHKGCFLYMGSDFRKIDGEERYLFYVCENGSRRVVYPKKISWLSYTPALSEKWAIANIREENDEPKYTMYAKVGEWNWTKLMEGLSYGPQIVNDKAVFYDDNFKAYYCDLSKNPKSTADCILVNETETEEIRTPVINEDDETEIIYESYVPEKMSMKRLQIGADGKKGERSMILDTHISSDETWRPVGYSLSKVTEDIIFYNETMNNGSTGDCNACFYNRKSKKTTCMKKVEGMEKYYFGFDEWEGKWLLYQFRAVALQAVRDLDCYCEKEGVCPFE